MIKRYSRPEMQAIWEPQNKFQKWLDIELAACEAHVELGNIPASTLKIIQKKAQFDVNRISAIEAEIHHDVIAFLTNVAEYVGPESRYVHLGLTSSDIVDTAFSLQLKEAGKLLLTDSDMCLKALKKQAKTHKKTLMMGRTHGVHAEPMTFGLKLTVWYEELKRNRIRLQEAIAAINVGKLSGAVGNYAHMNPKLELKVCKKLGLTPANISTQILQRDRHAQFMSTLAIIAGTIEKIATEIRHLQKTECNEVLEPFSKKQKGSSAMPHKRNPIICERMTGLARTIRGYTLTALENQSLWHERDISHSSAERIIFPDATILLDYMFEKMTFVLDNLQVNSEEMLINIDRSQHVFFSQILLLKLVEKGMLREEAYRIVQANALTAFKNKLSFERLVLNDLKIKKFITQKELKELFIFDSFLANIDMIYKRVYK